MGRIAGITDDYLRRVEAVKQYNATKGEREALDKKMMMPSAPASLYELPEPGVIRKLEFKKNKNPQHLKDGKHVEFYSFDDTPMGDWDWPDDIHAGSSVNIRNMGDVYDRLNRFTHDNPNSRFRVYMTPGGVRAFDMTNKMTPRKYDESGMFRALQVDPNYYKLAMDQPKAYGTDGFMPDQGFATRTSGKPGRKEDFVAFYLGDVGKGLPNPENRRIVTMYHDMPIIKNIAKEGMSPEKLVDSGVELLARQLPTVPKEYQQAIKGRMAGMGVWI